MSKVQYSAGKSFPLSLKVPAAHAHRFNFVPCVQLTDEEQEYFSLALHVFFSGVEKSGAELSEQDHAIVLFLPGDDISLRLCASRDLATHMPLIAFHMDRIRSRELSWEHMLVVFLEELVHCFFHIRDEEQAKSCVAALMQLSFSHLTREHLYSPFEDPGRD